MNEPTETPKNRAMRPLLGGASLAAILAAAGCSHGMEGKSKTDTMPATTTQTGSATDVTKVTTEAVGEEDGAYQAPAGDYIATTLAIGEEDGGIGQPIPVEPDGGIGDGAGPIPDDGGTVTTLAIGEEDGGIYQPVPGDGTATTLAVGEEDGGVYQPVPDSGTVTTLAIGEG